MSKLQKHLLPNHNVMICFLYVFYWAIIKVPDLKSLENEFSLNWQIWSLYRSTKTSMVKKLPLNLICKQFEKTTLMFLIVVNGGLETTFSNFQEGFFVETTSSLCIKFHT